MAAPVALLVMKMPAGSNVAIFFSVLMLWFLFIAASAFDSDSMALQSFCGYAMKLVGLAYCIAALRLGVSVFADDDWHELQEISMGLKLGINVWFWFMAVVSYLCGDVLIQKRQTS